METFTEDPFEFQEARIVNGDEGAGIGVMVGLKGHERVGHGKFVW